MAASCASTTVPGSSATWSGCPPPSATDDLGGRLRGRAVEVVEDCVCGRLLGIGADDVAAVRQQFEVRARDQLGEVTPAVGRHEHVVEAVEDQGRKPGQL